MNLSRKIKKAFRLDTSSNRLTYDDLLHCEGLLVAFKAKDIARRYNQPLARARILPAGALIIRGTPARAAPIKIRESPIDLQISGALS